MLGGFGQAEGGMQKEWGRNLQQIDSPRFASYATLQRGKDYEREYAEWCGWLADLLEKGADQIKRSRLS
jgi:Virulence activator alpha C-term